MSDEITPAERRRLRVRDAILEAADAVYTEEGAAGLSIRRLADSIDYSPAAIYKYFESKNELIDELKEAFFERLLVKMDEMNKVARPFPEKMRECVASYVRTALERPRHYAEAFADKVEIMPDQCDETPSPLSQKHQAFFALQSLIEEGMASGHFSQLGPAEWVAKSAWASMHGLAMLFAHLPSLPEFDGAPDLEKREQFLRFHADLIVRGLEQKS